MKRRAFLKYGLIMSAGITFSGLPLSVRSAPAATEAPWRTFTVTTRLEITEASGPVRAWVPIPLTSATEYFRAEPAHWTGNCSSATTITYDQYGTGLVFAEWSGRESTPLLEVVSHCQTHNRQIDLSQKPSSRSTEVQATLDSFRQPSQLIRTDGLVAATAHKIVAGHQSDVAKARALYDWIIDHTFRDPHVKGCGSGDMTTMLETGYLGGKCADLNALFVGLARAAGLPARDVYGIRCAPSAEFRSLGRADDMTGAQHCRAEVYLTGYGWTPDDPADVRKVVLEENAPGAPLPLDDPQVRRARAKLFGAWEMNWLPYNYAQDVQLPHSDGPTLSHLMYRQAETAHGRKESLDPQHFRYTIMAKEL